jgi:aspartyl-tRNA(Asn)/glutamyl-tRNA(Gln) amidotransferase subunit B
MNSFRFIEQGINAEVARQTALVQAGERVQQETLHFDPRTETLTPLRSKEEAHDYRYFPDPDLVPVTVSQEQLDAVRAAMGELPSQQRQRLQTQYGLSPYAASVLTAKGRPTVAYFEEVAAAVGDGKLSADRISDLVFPALTNRQEEIADFPIRPATFADFLKKTAPIGQDPRRKAFEHMLEHSTDAAAAMTALGIKTDFDEAALRGAVRAAIAANPKAVEDYKSGKAAAANRIKGDVMRANKGAPNDMVQRLMEEELAKV